jgi:hypothetical protein
LYFGRSGEAEYDTPFIVCSPSIRGMASAGVPSPPPSAAVARLDRLLRALEPASSFDVAEFVSEGLDALSLEQLRSYLHARLEATRSEVRPAGGGQGAHARRE